MEEKQPLEARMDVQDKNFMFSEVREYLRGESADGSGNLYSHLVATLAKLLKDRPPDANELFEEISAGVRDNTVLPKSPPTEDEALQAVIDGADQGRKSVLAYARMQTPLFEKPPQKVATIVSFPQNILDSAKLWEWAGVSFGTYFK